MADTELVTRNNAEEENLPVTASPCPRVSPSPRPRLSPSPHPRVSPSPCPPDSPSPRPPDSVSPRPRVSPSPHPRVSASSLPYVSAPDLRILLWDIDGTLIRSLRSGAFKEYTIPVLEAVFGTSGCLAEMKVSGMTDLQIVGEALRNEGFTHEHIRERIDQLRTLYMEEMRKATNNGKQFFEVLPGVRETLEAIALHPRYHSALLTGNIEPAARLKMELMGLSEFFDLPGAFGDESHDRRDLPVRAVERIRRHLNLDLQPHQFIVIGDTPNDIDCAHHFGARAIAVATGRFYSAEDLLAHEPDALLPDLSNVGQVMEVLARL